MTSLEIFFSLPIRLIILHPISFYLSKICTKNILILHVENSIKKKRDFGQETDASWEVLDEGITVSHVPGFRSDINFTCNKGVPLRPFCNKSYRSSIKAAYKKSLTGINQVRLNSARPIRKQPEKYSQEWAWKRIQMAKDYSVQSATKMTKEDHCEYSINNLSICPNRRKQHFSNLNKKTVTPSFNSSMRKRFQSSKVREMTKIGEEPAYSRRKSKRNKFRKHSYCRKNKSKRGTAIIGNHMLTKPCIPKESFQKSFDLGVLSRAKLDGDVMNVDEFMQEDTPSFKIIKI